MNVAFAITKFSDPVTLPASVFSGSHSYSKADETVAAFREQLDSLLGRDNMLADLERQHKEFGKDPIKNPLPPLTKQQHAQEVQIRKTHLKRNAMAEHHRWINELARDIVNPIIAATQKHLNQRQRALAQEAAEYGIFGELQPDSVSISLAGLLVELKNGLAEIEREIVSPTQTTLHLPSVLGLPIVQNVLKARKVSKPE